MDKASTRKLQGIITKLSTPNTVRVRVEHKAQHPLYKKIISRHTHYLADCADSSKFEIGQAVLIEEARPVSKRKAWRVVGTDIQVSEK